MTLIHVLVNLRAIKKSSQVKCEDTSSYKSLRRQQRQATIKKRLMEQVDKQCMPAHPAKGIRPNDGLDLKAIKVMNKVRKRNA